MTLSFQQCILIITIGSFCFLGNGLASECMNNIPPNNPDSAYVDHGDGTVTDVRTGLMWKQCEEGKGGEDCNVVDYDDNSGDWAWALSKASSSTFAGHDDWRLPNVKELTSLVETCRVNPVINISLFPNTSSSQFWTGSPGNAIPGANLTWYVNFSTGGVWTASGSRVNNYMPVRLVRNAN